MGDVNQRLKSALDAARYRQPAYYAIPGGFAIVTHVEQINPRGIPMAEPTRWDAAIRFPEMLASLRDFLEGLRHAPAGDYRLFLFSVGPAFAPRARDALVTHPEAQAWLAGGLTSLPRASAERPFTPDDVVAVRVYEFHKESPDSEIEYRLRPRLSARTHLDRAGVWRAISPPAPNRHPTSPTGGTRHSARRRSRHSILRS